MHRIKNFFNANLKTNKSIKLPKILMTSNIPVNKEDLEKVSIDHKIEREWYKDIPVFRDSSAIKTAFQKGILVRVEETENFQPIMRLRNHELEEQYPPFLTKKAYMLLIEICREWRDQMNKEGINPNIRLAITSLTRSYDYQQEIVASGKLALSDGPHLRGEAFDIDGCGYYNWDKPVNPRQKQVGQKFQEAFEELGAGLKKPEIEDYSHYQPRVHQILQEVLERKAKEGVLHYLHEFPNTTNTVYHIARNPNYSH